MTFEQEVLLKLGRLEERSETQTKLLESLNRDGCIQGRTDRERLGVVEREQAKLWKYARALHVPERRTKRWVAFGTAFGAAVAAGGKIVWDWLTNRG